MKCAVMIKTASLGGTIQPLSHPYLPPEGPPTFGVLPQLGSMLRPNLRHGSVPIVRGWACHPGQWEWGSRVHAAMREPHAGALSFGPACLVPPGERREHWPGRTIRLCEITTRLRTMVLWRATGKGETTAKVATLPCASMDQTHDRRGYLAPHLWRPRNRLMDTSASLCRHDCRGCV